MSGGAESNRQQQLEEIEKHISAVLSSAGQAMQELSKDKPSIKQMESHTTTYLKTLEKIESGLYKQIEYLTQVSTSVPHEGSSYAAQKDLQMARHRLEHVRSRVAELERLRAEHRGMHRQPPRHQVPGGGGSSGGEHLSNMLRGGHGEQHRGMMPSPSHQMDYQPSS